MATRRNQLAPLALMLAIVACLSLVAASGAETNLVSVSSAGAQADAFSAQPALSGRGRHVVFVSSAGNLVRGDTNGHADVFVHDRELGKTRRVSIGGRKTEANDASDDPSISANGRYVAFVSSASNLVRGDTNGHADVFVRDRKQGKTKRVSIGPRGREANCGCFDATISANGRFVALSSAASNLVRGDSNDARDVFVHDLRTRRTQRVSIDSAGAQGDGGSFAPSISANGQFVAFSSEASNLVQDDTNAGADIFVRDRKGRKTLQISRGRNADPDGDSLAPSISANGRSVAFSSTATNLVRGDRNGLSDVFVGVLRGKTKRLSVTSQSEEGNDESFAPSLSGSAGSVAFYSYASDLIGTDTNGVRDVFVHTLKNGKTKRISMSDTGAEGNDESFAPSLSADGRATAFSSLASNLVSGDTNGVRDVFVR